MSLTPLAAGALALLVGLAQEPEPIPPAADSAEAPAEQTSTTTGRVSIRGVEYEYEATAGDLLLEDEEGEDKARVFYTAYRLPAEEETPSRPVTFCFNGGPGSSSVWLHLGMLGPRRVEMTDEGWPTPPPYRVVANEHSILDATDLVFIDPVTTGYSRPAPGQEAGQFHGRTNDVRWVAEFIRLWTTRHERWDSPKFLAGESYGTTRAAGLAGELQARHGMYLNGLILISSILDFQTARFDAGNDLPYLLFLPTYTATAWYHGELEGELRGDLAATLRRAEDFALGDYARALLLGDRLPAGERDAVAAELARLTGLSREYVEASNLRVPIWRFCKELQRAERRTTGRLDSRFSGHDADAAGDSYEFDPSYAAIQGCFSGALNHYLRAELGYESDLPYEILTGRVHPWSYGEDENRYVNVAETLRKEMTRNPALKVYVASGFYDLATPYFATRYTFDHLGLEPHLRSNVTIGEFEAGHMMYIHRESRVALHDQLGGFLAEAASRD